MISLTLKDGYKTRLLIAETGKSLREFANDISISHSYLSQILTGKRNPSPAVALKIANGLNVEIKDIFLVSLVDISNTGY